MTHKIWIPEALEGIEKVEAFINQDISSPEEKIELDYPQVGQRPLEEFIEAKNKEEYSAMVSLLSYPMNRENLNKISHLKAISNYAVGYNNIDLDAARELGIPVGYTPDVLNEATADTALTLLLMCCRKVPYVTREVKEGNWQSFELKKYNGIDPRDLRIGIIGMGRIGETFARKCYKLWGNKIFTLKRKSLENREFDFPIQIVEEEEFFKEVNLVSLHCPLTDQTHKMFNRAYIQKFKHPLLFINTARGAIHEEEDLLWALREGKIISLGLDVTDPEPMDKDHQLLKDDRAIIFPHIGSATKRTRSEMSTMALRNLAEVLRGRTMPHEA